MTTRAPIGPGDRTPVVSRASAVRVPSRRDIPWSVPQRSAMLLGDYWRGSAPTPGAKVSLWPDASGSGSDLFQTVVAQQPTYNVDSNGRGYLEFLGVEEIRTAYKPYLDGPLTWMIVSQSYSTTAQRFVGAVGSTGIADGLAYCRTTAPSRALVYEGVGTVTAGGATLLQEAVVITRASNAPAAQSRLWVRSGGVSVEQTLTPSSVLLLKTPTGGLVVGARGNSTGRWLGRVYAVLATEYAASTTLVDDLLGWAGEYYGL